jgi:hypothetical protein
MPILTPDDGLVARTPEEAQALQFRGYQQCYGTRSSKAQGAIKGPCDFHLAPEAQEYVKDKGGYYTCPRCYQSHDLMHDLPWHGVPYEENRQGFSAGGGTRIGLSLKDQSQIGEDLVQGLGERQGGLPGYGPVTWVAKNLKGVLGLLVILNYRTGLADIYAREFPVNPVTGAGVGTFRSGLSQHLIAEVPFKNPFMDPNHPAPTTAGPVDNQGEEMPF